MQKVCNMRVDEINILSLNVGVDLPILMSYQSEKADKTQDEYFDVVRGGMIESNFLRSDADFIAL